MKKAEFEWDSRKNQLNIEKHEIDFYDAQQAFLDGKRVIAEDLDHSHGEKTLLLFRQNIWSCDDSALYLAE